MLRGKVFHRWLVPLFHPGRAIGFQGIFKACAEYGQSLEFFPQFPFVSGVFELFPECGQLHIDLSQILLVNLQFFFSSQPQGGCCPSAVVFPVPEAEDAIPHTQGFPSQHN